MGSLRGDFNMGTISLKDFQVRVISDLLISFNSFEKEIIFKSCTGSGKTIVLTHFIDEFFKENSGYVFIWLTPGKGNLEEQSKNKMDIYIHNPSTKLLNDIMTDGFQENDVCFINWELVTKKDNNALKDGERKNLIEIVEEAHRKGLRFNIIVDEEHLNKTYKANDIISLFKAEKIIRASATPHNYGDATVIEIPEEEVIAAGLIKKMLIINEGLEQGVKLENQVKYLLDKAILKQRKIKEEFNKVNAKVNPLIVIQLPNNDESLLYEVEGYLKEKGITYENRSLAVWLADKKENLEEIEDNQAEPIAIIIKQAVATGWDCPRAHILVKLRNNMEETFEIQTIGRIRRMPQAKHYDNNVLDMCYLYTFDEKFTEGVKLHLGKGAYEAKQLFLKDDYKEFKLVKEYKSTAPVGIDAKIALNSVFKYYEKKYNLSSDKFQNNIKLQSYGYTFDKDIIFNTYQGNVSTLVAEHIKELNRVGLRATLNTHEHGRMLHKATGLIGMSAGLPYDKINTILRRLFLKGVNSPNKILSLDVKEYYAFIINNQDRLKDDLLQAIADESNQIELKLQQIYTIEFKIPREYTLTYDASLPHSKIYLKNVYDGYLSNAAPRSDTEMLFEKYCETSDNIKWFYKNGDSGSEYMSIVFTDNAGKQRLFYPDFILQSVKGNIWIIETKGGEAKSGKSENIDKFAAKKFSALMNYCSKHNVKGGFVRLNRSVYELFINTTDYTENMKDKQWKLLDQVIL